MKAFLRPQYIINSRSPLLSSTLMLSIITIAVKNSPNHEGLKSLPRKAPSLRPFQSQQGRLQQETRIPRKIL